MSGTPTKREWAIALAESGQRIFPLVINGKTPANEGNWQKSATSDPARVAEMWSCPVMGDEIDYNIGIALAADTLVFDEDTRDDKQGEKSRKLLEATHGALPKTFTVRTASGGRHRYYKTPTPVANSASKVGQHIDIKSFGGFVVGPGSTIDGHTYMVETIERTSVAPPWLIDLAGAPRRRSRQEALCDAPPPAKNPGRAVEWITKHAPDNGTYAVAAKVREFGVTEIECTDLLMDHWPPAEAKGYDHVALRVANAYRYAQNVAGAALAETEFQAVEIDKHKAASTGWHDPANLWERETAPRALPKGVAPSYVESFADDRARRLGVSPGAMAAAAITTLGALVPAGNNLHLRQHSDSWSVKCTLWTALVGDPGTAKSPALGAAMAFPKAVEAEWRADFKKACEANEFSSGDVKRRRKRSTDATAEPDPDLSEAAGVFSDEPLPQPKPQLRRKIVNDATTEAIGAVLAADDTAAPVLLHSDELAGFISNMDAYRARGGKDRPFFLQAKDGGPYAIDRKATGTLFIPSLAISIAGTIQDEKLAKIASELTDDGLLQRFALIAIERLGRGEDFPDDVRLNNSIGRVATALADLESHDYRLAPNAMSELARIEDFRDQEIRRPDIAFGLKTWLDKTPNEFGRYCLAFHLIEWASSIYPALEKPPAGIVSLETARRARRYIEEFLYPHTAYVYSTVMARGSDDDEVRWVAGYILTRDLQTITAREIGRAYRSLRGPQRRAKLRSVMATLAMQDWVKITNEIRGEWKINPVVYDGRFAAIKHEETERRAAVKAEIATTVSQIRSARGDFQ